MTVVASNFERKANDLYETEEWATEALLRHIDISEQSVWEPSAGNHKIVDVLLGRCKQAFPSDIEMYDRRHLLVDFFDPDAPIPSGHKARVDWIITNPPYGKGNRLAVRYAELALERADNVALLLTAKFDFGKTRQHLFKDNPRFRMKIALTDRMQWFPNTPYKASEDHAWYIWGPDSYEPRMAWEGK